MNTKNSNVDQNDDEMRMTMMTTMMTITMVKMTMMRMITCDAGKQSNFSPLTASISNWHLLGIVRIMMMIGIMIMMIIEMIGIMTMLIGNN